MCMWLATLLCSLMVAPMFLIGTAMRISRSASFHQMEDDLPPVETPEAEDKKTYEEAYQFTLTFVTALANVEIARRQFGEIAHECTFENIHQEVKSMLLLDNLFALCGIGWNDLADLDGWREEFLQSLAQGQQQPAVPVLQYLGKKKKGGVFWRTPLREPAGFLLKSVHNEELPLLARLRNGISKRYADCAAFQSTLLLPVLFHFREGSQGYIVMRDETLRLTQLAGEHWNVVNNYDIKPLPNLSDDLSALLSLLFKFLDESSPVLNAWHGWQTVYDAVTNDVALLDESWAVDYSLFIHILEPVNSDAATVAAESIPPVEGLDAAHGCITEPSGKAIACIKIIDFMTPYTIWRGVESYGRSYKFSDYGTKILKALDCFGNIQDDECVEYQDYGDVKEKVAPVSGSDAKAVAFVRSSLFEHEYQCKVSRAQNYWMNIGDNGYMMEVRTFNASEATIMPGVRMINPSPEYSNEVAKNLRQYLLGAAVVGNDFSEFVEGAHSASIAQREKVLPEDKVQECLTGIENFATRTWAWKRSRNDDLENVVWSEEKQAVFVVREKPYFSSNDDTVKEMSENGCYLSTYLYRCHPIQGWTVTLDYRLKFGALEILAVEAARYNPEFPIWANSTL